MAAATFDTHKLVKQLEVAGFKTEQAEAVVDAVSHAQMPPKLWARRICRLPVAIVSLAIGLANRSDDSA